jgi:hypothetical protein
MIGLREAARGSTLERPWSAMWTVTIVALAVALFLPLSRMDEWVGWLPGTISIYESTAILLPTLLGAVAAWTGGLTRAHGLSEWASASPTTSGHRLLPTLVLVGSVTLFVELVTIAVLFVISAHFGLADGWVASDLIVVIPSVMAYVGVWVVIGGWVGSKLRREIALLVAALLPYLWYALSISVFVGKPVEVLAIGDPGTFDYLRPTMTAVISRALVWLVLLILLCVVLYGSRKLALRIAWLLSALTAVTIFLASPVVLLPGVLDSVCAGDAPKACLEGSYRTTLPRYRQAINELWPSIPRAIRPKVVASIPNVVPSGEQALIVPPVSGNFLAPARLIDRNKFAAWMGDELFLSPCQGTEITDAALTLLFWWRLGHQIALDGSNYPGDADFTTLTPDFERLFQYAVAFSNEPHSEQELWFDTNKEAILTCTAPLIGT